MVGLGNVLSTYAFYYLYAMYNKQPFEFQQDLTKVSWKSKREDTFRMKKKDKMLRYLPWKIDFDNTLSVDSSIAIEEKINTCGLFFHLKSYGILENVDILYPLFKKVIDEFEPRKFDFHPNDVVIHVRTGDIFSNKHQAFYSSIHFSCYVDLLRDKKLHNIYIVWKSDRKQDRPYDTYSNAMIDHLQQYLQNILNVPVITERQACDDFVFMTQAPLLIACISTYSMWAALLNKNKSIIPQCKNHFNNRIYKGSHFEIVPLRTVCKYKKDITEFCNQFTAHH